MVAGDCAGHFLRAAGCAARHFGRARDTIYPSKGDDGYNAVDGMDGSEGVESIGEVDEGLGRNSIFALPEAAKP
jgi:hypothetical protein